MGLMTVLSRKDEEQLKAELDQATRLEMAQAQFGLAMTRETIHMKFKKATGDTPIEHRLQREDEPYTDDVGRVVAFPRASVPLPALGKLREAKETELFEDFSVVHRHDPWLIGWVKGTQFGIILAEWA